MAEIEKEPWLVSVSYQRDALEELQVHTNARRRFSGPLDETFLYQSALFAIVTIVLMVVAIEVSRHYMPFFPDAPGFLAYHGQYWAAFLPMVLLFVVAVFGYARMLRRKRDAIFLSRLRAKGWADVEISSKGFVFVVDARNQRFDWRAVRNVSHVKDKILLDLDQSVVYIPERAFSDRATFLAQYKVIRQAWHDRLMEEVAEKG